VEGWSLEVVDEENASTVWDELFETDQAALDEFMKEVAEAGLAKVINPDDVKIH